MLTMIACDRWRVYYKNVVVINLPMNFDRWHAFNSFIIDERHNWNRNIITRNTTYNYFPYPSLKSYFHGHTYLHRSFYLQPMHICCILHTMHFIRKHCNSFSSYPGGNSSTWKIPFYHRYRNWITKVGRTAKNRKVATIKQSFLCWRE